MSNSEFCVMTSFLTLNIKIAMGDFLIFFYYFFIIFLLLYFFFTGIRFSVQVNLFFAFIVYYFLRKKRKFVCFKVALFYYVMKVVL